jgi:hypothetical protein
MQPGTPIQQKLSGVVPSDAGTHGGQWRPGRLLIALVVMISVVVGAWMITQ